MATNRLTGNMAPQGQITTVLSVPYSEIKRRMDIGNGKPITGQLYPGGPDGMNQKYSKNELLLSSFKDKVNSAGRPQQTALPSVNGLLLVGHNTKDTMRNFTFAGINKTDFDPLDTSAPQSGLAAIVSGTADTWYTGDKSCYPGQKIRIGLPSLTESSSNNNIPQWDGKPKNKIPPTLSPVNYDDIDNFEHLLVKLATTTDAGGVLQEDSINRNHSHDQQLAIMLKEHANAAALHIIHGFVKAGVITINTPEIQANIASSANEAALRANLGLPAAGSNRVRTNPLDSNGANDAATIKPVEDIIMTISVDKIPNKEKTALTTEFLQQQERSLLWMAGTLGVVSSMAPKVSYSLQKTAVKSLYPNSAFFSNSSHKHKLNPKLLSDEPGAASKYVAQYQKSANDFQVKYRQVFADEKQECDRTIIGTCMSYTTKGENHRIDLVLGLK